MAVPAHAIRRPHVSQAPAATKLRVLRPPRSQRSRIPYFLLFLTTLLCVMLIALVLPPRRQRARIPFFALCLTILIGAMLGALVLNTSMASTAYQMHSFQLELARTLQSNEEQAAEVDRLSSPSRLAEKAESLGMV